MLLLYRHAWGGRARLALTPAEEVETRFSIAESIVMIGVGTLSILLALLSHPVASGMVYMLIAPLQTVQGFRRGRHRRALQARTPTTGETPQ